MDDRLLMRVLMGDATPDEAAGVRAWRGRSEENERRFRELSRLLELAARADGMRALAAAPPTARDIVARAERGRPLRGAPRPGGGRAPRIAAAAVLLLLALGSVPLVRWLAAPPAFAPREFVTGPADQATVVLTDGSVVRLGGESRLHVPAEGRGREVTVEGRAFFAVSRDEARPFVVRTGTRRIRVLGTRFAVDAAGEDVEVRVVEGRVALRPAATAEQVEILGGQTGRVEAGSSTVVVDALGDGPPAEWTGDFLVFQNTPLRDALAEIGWTYGVDVRLTDAALAERTVTAWFSGWTLDAVVEVVCAVADVECSVSGSTLTVSPRRAPAAPSRGD